MPFMDPIVGTGGDLIREAIRSPNYVTGVSGWTINQDGTAEFQSVALHGTLPWSDLTAGDIVTDGTLNGGALTTPATGFCRLLINGGGLVTYDSNGDESIRLDAATGYGIFTGNVIIVDPVTKDTLASLTDEGEVTAINGRFSDEIYVEGLATVGLADNGPNIPRIPGGGVDGSGGAVIDSLGYGLVSYGPFAVNNGRVVAPGVTWGLCTQSFQAEAGRLYMVELSNLWITTAGTGSYHEPILYMNFPAFADDQTTVSPPLGTGTFMGFDLHGNVSQHKCQCVFGPYACGTGGDWTFPGLVQMTCGMLNPAAGINLTYRYPSTAKAYQAMLNVYDVGPYISATTGYLDVGIGGSAPPTKNYKKIYRCNASGTYDDSTGNHIGAFGQEMIQGPNPYWGNVSAMACFPNMTADLAGATIKGMSVTSHNHHSYYNAGCTMRLGLHGNATLPATFNIGAWPNASIVFAKGATVTTAIPSTYWAGFQAGLYKGFNCHSTGGNTYYGRWDGNGYSREPYITVSYTK